MYIYVNNLKLSKVISIFIEIFMPRPLTPDIRPFYLRLPGNGTETLWGVFFHLDNSSSFQI